MRIQCTLGKIGNGDLSKNLNIKTKDEIEDIALSINKIKDSFCITLRIIE